MGRVQAVAVHGIYGSGQDLLHAVVQGQAAGGDRIHAVGFPGNRQIAGAHRKGNVVFRLDEPLEELHRSFDLFLLASSHHHAGTLLHGNLFAVCKLRAGQRLHADIVALVGIVRHPRGEEGSAGTGANIAQHVAGLDIVTAEAAAGGKPALDEGHVVVIPQLAGRIVLKVDGHFAVLHLKDGTAQLLCAHQHVVCHSIAAEQGLAVVRGSGLGIGPVVVFFSGVYQTFHGGKVVVAGTGGLGKGLPVGVVEEHHLGGFCHREDLYAAVGVKVALREVAVNKLGLLVIGQVGCKIHHHPHLIQRIDRIGISREHVGHGGRTHLAFGSIHHALFQIVHAALTLGGHHDALLGTHGLVELVHKIGKAFQLVAVIISPHRNVSHLRGLCILGAAAAANAAKGQCRGAQPGHDRFEIFFHQIPPEGAHTAGRSGCHITRLYLVYHTTFFRVRKQNPAKIFTITRKRKNFPPIGTKSTALPIGWEKLCFAAVIRFFLPERWTQ